MSLHTFQSLAMWDWVYWKSFAPPPPPLDPPLLKKKTFCCNTVTCRNILIWVSKILAAWWQKVVRIGWFRSIGVNEACNQLDIAILACFPCHMGKGLHISKYEFACAYVTLSGTLWGALGHSGTLWDTMRQSGTLLDTMRHSGKRPLHLQIWVCVCVRNPLWDTSLFLSMNWDESYDAVLRSGFVFGRIIPIHLFSPLLAAS